MAKLGVGIVKNVLMTVIMVVILFTMLDDTAADVQDAASNLSSATGSAADTYPLISFFKKKGILLLAFIAGVIIMLISAFMGGK